MPSRGSLETREVCSRGHMGHIYGEGKPGRFAALRGLPTQLQMVRSEAGLLLGQGALRSVTWGRGRTEEEGGRESR